MRERALSLWVNGERKGEGAIKGQAAKLNAERSDLETRCDGLDTVLIQGITFTTRMP